MTNGCRPRPMMRPDMVMPPSTIISSAWLCCSPQCLDYELLLRVRQIRIQRKAYRSFVIALGMRKVAALEPQRLIVGLSVHRDVVHVDAYAGGTQHVEYLPAV